VSFGYDWTSRRITVIHRSPGTEESKFEWEVELAPSTRQVPSRSSYGAKVSESGSPSIAKGLGVLLLPGRLA
jgi:hypothetical protein